MNEDDTFDSLKYARSYNKAMNAWVYLNADGDFHRENGPAIEFISGDKAWCINGRLHREGGPAIEYRDGKRQWWLNGDQVR